MRVSRIFMVVAAGLVAAACGSGAGGSGATVGGPVASIGQSSASSVPTSRNELGGIGSSPADMAYIHGRAQPASGPCATVDTCFGPSVTNTQDGSTYAFAGVTLVGGLVAGYDQNFVDGTTVAEALKAVFAVLPADAHASALTPIYGATDSCAFVNVTSPTLSALFPAQSSVSVTGVISDSVVGIEFSGATATGFTMYDPSDVQVAHVVLGADSTSMAC